MKEKIIENFTPSQKEALVKIKEFLDNKNIKSIQDRVFVLSGQAGTGKTTIVKYALENWLKDDIENCSPEVSAVGMFNIPHVIGVTMSHKAKKVLNSSIHIVTTYASYFGLKQTYGEDGSINFEKDKYAVDDPPCTIPVDVVIHDECSMYDDVMRKMVEEETNPHCKIIFMGDPGQLPPINTIGDNDSPIFSYYKNGHQLIERVRQTKGNPIIELSDVVYEQIFRKDYDINNDDRLEIVYRAFKDEKIIDGKGFRTVFYNDFLKDYRSISEDIMDSKIIAYRNDKVTMLNEVIRNDIYNKPVNNFIEGEIIYMNDSFTYKVKGDRYPKWTCYNSDEYKITNITEDTIEGVHVYLLYIDKEGHKHLEKAKAPFIVAVSQKGKRDFDSIAYGRKAKALKSYGPDAKRAWKYYYDFINQFGNLSYGYCYTGYKSQGSTFKNIYIDVNDIVTVGPISNKRKLQALYTAITRASHLVTFLKKKP